MERPLNRGLLLLSRIGELQMAITRKLPSNMGLPSSQPNLATSAAEPGFTRRFWLLVVFSGIGAGLAGGGLMLILDTVQHLPWGPGANDDLLGAIQRSSSARRVLSLGVAGVWVAATGLLLRRVFGA